MTPPRLWPALDVRPAPSAGSDAEDLQGAVLAALDDSVVSAVQELEGAWRIFFTTPADRDGAITLLTRRWPEMAVVPVDVADEDWARRSQQNLGPVRVGQVLISPPWAAPAATDDHAAVEVVIQPSMGFGTGHHQTTRLCIALLQQIDLAGRRVLDVGTGSGILAIVASRLGADAVLAVDDDADALQSAAENLELNGITSGVELRRADFRELPASGFDVVLANLTGALLVRGAETLADAVAAAGSLIVSGLTLDEEGSVREALGKRLVLATRLEEDEWAALRLTRPGRP